MLHHRHILIVTSFPEFGTVVKEALQAFTKNSEIEICKWKEFARNFRRVCNKIYLAAAELSLN
jgi:hypothetical protein